MDQSDDFDIPEPVEQGVIGMETVQLCEVLANWSPFDLPSQALIDVLQLLGLNLKI